MRALSAMQLLDVWEQGFGQPPFQQAMLLLAAACPELSTDMLADQTIGQRDEQLLRLRELLFGSRMTAMTNCPACNSRNEFTMTTAELLAVHERSEEEQLSYATGEYNIEFRLPRTKDLQAIATEADPAKARARILEDCITMAFRSDERTTVASLPEEIVAAVTDRMGEAGRRSDALFALSCPQCGHQWREVFDIATFLWSEISAWAYHTLRDVHALASRYGWSEVEILAMSAFRRQQYLTLVGV